MTPAPVSPIILSPDLTATEALDVIVRAAGEHVSQHVGRLRTERDPESLHQVRIGARRARVAISLLRRPLGDGEKLAWVSAEIRDLGVPLGRARDLDVAVRDHATDLTGPSRERLLHRQSGAWDEVLEVIGSDRWSDLRTHVDMLLRHLHEEVPLDPPVLDAAGAALERRYRRVLKGGAHLDRGSRAERHAVRKEAKKLRYGVQFFSGLYAVLPESAHEPRSAPSEFERRATELQDALGDLGDLETSHHLLELVGAHQPQPDKKPHLKRATAAVRHLEALEPFWRDRGR
ncbi:CHAD domain-containing protein [Knoellia locipacati]|uniref:CHAD domain-containing protein n=1 Tax=Knoellia locipacati TaxID=882824 RepID=UPI00384B112E